jgi:nickel-dependent lactate racemase
MPETHVPWGDGELLIPVPDDWTLMTPACPTIRPAAEDWKQRLAAALNQPVSGPTLSERLRKLGEDGRISFVVEDLTRHSPLPDILEVVLREIRHAGISDEQMEIVFGCGMHPPMTDDEARAKLGPAIGGIRWRHNPWHDISQYEDLGRAGKVNVLIDRGVVRSDLRIPITSVSPHLQAGFGGGYKMYFPGCGEISSIRHLHRMGIARRGQRQLVGMDPQINPMRRIIDRAGAMIDAAHGQTFSVQYLLDADDLPTSIAAGEPVATHRMLTKTCGNSCGVIQENLADIVVTNAHPRDHDLWQCFKAIPNTCWAAREGGVVICLARCPAGLNEMKTLSWPLSPNWTRRVIRFLGPNTISSLMDRLVKELAGDSQWFIRLATQIIQRNHLMMVSPNLVEQGVDFPGIAMFADVESALQAAGRLLGGSSQRVAVYPSGGASYPIIHA